MAGSGSREVILETNLRVEKAQGHPRSYPRELGPFRRKVEHSHMQSGEVHMKPVCDMRRKRGWMGREAMEFVFLEFTSTLAQQCRPRGDMVGFGPLLMCDNRLRTSILTFLVGHMRIHKKFITPPCIYSIFMT